HDNMFIGFIDYNKEKLFFLEELAEVGSFGVFNDWHDKKVLATFNIDPKYYRQDEWRYYDASTELRSEKDVEYPPSEEAIAAGKVKVDNLKAPFSLELLSCDIRLFVINAQPAPDMQLSTII